MLQLPSNLANFLKMTAVQIFKSKATLLPLLYIVLILISYRYACKSIQSIKNSASHQKQVSDAQNLLRNRIQRSLPVNSTEAVAEAEHHGSTRRSDSAEIRTDSQDGLKSHPRNVSILYPWAGDAECEQYFVQFAPDHTFQPRALVSFPGSGNSWLRYLIEGATGYFTGSIFHDKRIYDSGLLGEFRSPNDGSTIVQKTHHDSVYVGTRRRLQAFVKLSELMFQYKGILLIRNPHDALKSYWNFRATKDHKGITKSPDANTKGWAQFVAVGIQKWASLIKAWVGNSMDLIIVMYEDLKHNPKEELVKILHFLEQPVDHKRLNCVVKHIEGPFHRVTTSYPHPSKPVPQNNAISDHGALEQLIQRHINDVNVFLTQNLLPLHLNYSGSVS